MTKHLRTLFATLALTFVFATPFGAASVARAGDSYGIPSCEPDSATSLEPAVLGGDVGTAAPSLSFCSEWNPEFPFNGSRCCSVPQRPGAQRRRRRSHSHVCAQQRAHFSFCSDMTEDQKSYVAQLAAGKIQNPLELISHDMGLHGSQSYCSVNNGFLAWGRPVVPSTLNRVQLRRPDRCSNFGTDNMAGLIEWTGQQIARKYAEPEYAGTRLVVGDVSAPRGGCLSGIMGNRGHLSHTSGQDADIGYLLPLKNRPSPSDFHTTFDAKTEWWLIKQLFKNPYACVKVIFLDKRNIRKLAKAARGDEEWTRLARFVRHQPGHRNHIHVRIGDGPGQPGCRADSHPELEEEDDADDASGDEGVPLPGHDFRFLRVNQDKGDGLGAHDYKEPNGAVELQLISRELDSPGRRLPGAATTTSGKDGGVR